MIKKEGRHPNLRTEEQVMRNSLQFALQTSASIYNHNVVKSCY